MTSLYKNRLEKLQKKISSLPFEGYLVEESINLFYLTGLELSLGSLLITPSSATLYVDGRYLEACQNLPFLTTAPLQTLSFPKGMKIGFNEEKTSYKKFCDLSKKTSSLTPSPDLVLELRTIKDTTECEKLIHAAKLGTQGFEYVQSLLKEGITEIELSNQLDIYWKQSGAKGVAFDPIIAFGANSSKPHYHPSSTPLKKGDTILIDIGVTLDHYHSDMTRVLFFGSPSAEMKKIYSIVLEAQEKALSLCKPGITTGEIDRAARDFITQQGYGENFMHGLGHGIGLEVHEAPTVRSTSPYGQTLLEPGMAITVEPGIYLANVGGVRIEDSVLITQKGHHNLTLCEKSFSILSPESLECQKFPTNTKN